MSDKKQMELALNRRRFFQFLAASPLVAPATALAQQTVEEAMRVIATTKIASPKDALSIKDFELAARLTLPPAHYGYMATGVDDDGTYRANLEGFRHYQLKSHKLVDVSKIDLKAELFGTTWDAPIFLSPVGEQKAFHPEGEVAVARAAKAKNAMQILSTVTSSSVEDVSKALGHAPWYQLYMPTTWDATEKMVKRAEAAGCPVMAWTIDLLGGRNTETMERFRRADSRECMDCHAGRGGAFLRPMFEGLAGGGINPPSATLDYIGRLKKLTKMKLVIKGIDNGEDAKACVDSGADGILVSNHGGRAAETGRATIDCLAEVVDMVGSRVPVMIDSGFRRGSDVFKALALGAKAVGIGRPYIYGLSSFGQPGVERVIDILRSELQLTMRQMGTTSISQITRKSIVKA
jgi:isopentenyl diphosphate isomerase/L-lactate dehydrogenase-like FMN-dependent dehydrogenase